MCNCYHLYYHGWTIVTDVKLRLICGYQSFTTNTTVKLRLLQQTHRDFSVRGVWKCKQNQCLEGSVLFLHGYDFCSSSSVWNSTDFHQHSSCAHWLGLCLLAPAAQPQSCNYSQCAGIISAFPKTLGQGAGFGGWESGAWMKKWLKA